MVKRVVIGLVVLAVLVGGGAALYGALRDDAPRRATVDDIGTSKEAGTVPGQLDGQWRLAGESKVGYRIRESFAGGLSNAEAVGTTGEVSGTMTLDGATVTAARFEAQTATMTSDSARRDGQYRRLMAVDQHPTATFTLTSPIELGAVPAEGTDVTASATGDLTLKGTTKTVTFEVRAKRAGAQINVDAAIPITFADYGIDSPSIPGVVAVEDNGRLELVLVFVR